MLLFARAPDSDASASAFRRPARGESGTLFPPDMKYIVSTGSIYGCRHLSHIRSSAGRGNSGLGAFSGPFFLVTRKDPFSGRIGTLLTRRSVDVVGAEVFIDGASIDYILGPR